MNATTHPCDRLKALLVEHGDTALERHPELAAHAADCPACRRLLQAWNTLPGLLNDLPEHEPDDALVKKVRAAVAGVVPVRRPAGGRRFLAPSLASAAILLAAVGISRELLQREAPRLPPPAELRSSDDLRAPGPRVTAEQPITGGRYRDEVDRIGREKSEDKQLQESLASEEESFERRDNGQRAFDADGQSRAANRALNFNAQTQPAAQPATPAMKQDDLRDRALSAQSGTDNAAVFGDREPAAVESPAEKAATVTGAVQTGADAADRFDQKKPSGIAGELGKAEPDSSSGFALNEVSAAIPAFDFFAHYSRTDGLAFQPATGYWANTHVPGDPAMRLLSARLAAWDRSWLQNNAGLERDVRPLPQPFDTPADNALALSLMADAAGIPAGAGLTRFRLQVGIQGIEHRRGHRPAMNLGVVFDLPPAVPAEVRIAARALLDALVESKQAGDRIAVVLTGTDKQAPGLVVEPDTFRFGTLQAATDHILGQGGEPADQGTGSSSEVIDTYAALHRAGELVRGSEDPARALGSSAVLLISARSHGDLDRLVALTHEHAKDGITTSVFPLGKGPGADETERLVLAGLGSRRILQAPAEARSLVEDELHASSRAVARAARLSIRLAPGVRLVDVIGSERLAEPDAQRVRDIENAVDRRLVADLGIAADRGQDEEGIQIVIPAIHSGDSAIVLLDLVTDRPGPIAEVTLRYKDLVYLRNGSLSAQLELPRADGTSPERGPAELAVLKNLLAHHFAVVVTRAADALGSGDAGAAAGLLRSFRAALEQARRNMPAWSEDPDLVHDQQVLDRYIAALESPQAATDQSFLADSLRLAAFAKQHGLPEEWQ
jgi:hypothetical protein